VNLLYTNVPVPVWRGRETLMVVLIVAGNRKSAARKGLMWYGIPQACKFFCKSVSCNNLLQTRDKGRKNSLKVS
jgi:hypothetical protein